MISKHKPAPEKIEPNLLFKLEKAYRNYYTQYRDKYRPEKIKYLFILESPPISGEYFYKNGKYTEALYMAIMRCVLRMEHVPENKEEGLEEFKKQGYFLFDASYIPLNMLENDDRISVIQEIATYTIIDLNKFKSSNMKTILIKNNICSLFDEEPYTKWYNIINKGIVVPYPAYNKNNKINFCKKINQILGREICPYHSKHNLEL